MSGATRQVRSKTMTQELSTYGSASFNISYGMGPASLGLSWNWSGEPMRSGRIGRLGRLSLT